MSCDKVESDGRLRGGGGGHFGGGEVVPASPDEVRRER